MPANNERWAAWLAEWSDEQLAKNSNFHYTLTKARRSLLQHPVALEHPDQLRQLKYFGDKIVGMIARAEQRSHGRHPDLGSSSSFNGPSRSPADPGFLSPERAPPWSSSQGSQLRFSYCDQSETPVPDQARARVEIHHDILLYAVLFRANQLSTAKASGLVAIHPSIQDSYKDSPETFTALLPETSPLATLCSPGLQPVQSHYRGTDPTRRATARPLTHDSPLLPTAAASISARAPILSRQPHVSLATTQERSTPVDLDFSLPTWSARDYEIVCLVDTREIKDAKSRDYIADELRKLGITVERRSLELGDVAWVAKSIRHHHQPNTVVLDFILERKRLDDLVASLTDGRFHEQKFRLKKSGISNVFFVVETAKKDQVDFVKSFDDQINTAVSSTQIVDEFFVHRTKDIQATVQLLRMLHEAVCEKYRGQDLYVIPPQKIQRENYEQLRQRIAQKYPYRDIAIPYDSFTLLNSKSTFQIAKECFAKQLLCIRGMSPERVAAVVERYGTLRSLWESFRHAMIEEAIQTTEAAESGTRVTDSSGKPQRPKGKKKAIQIAKAELMLAELGHGRRRVGPELSKRVFHLFTDVVYD